MNKKNMKYFSLLLTFLVMLSSFTGCSTAYTADNSANSSNTLLELSVGIAEITSKYDAEDLDDSWDAANATKIKLNGSSFTIDGAGAAAEGSVLNITKAGTYVLSGTLNDGQIIVNAGENDMVRLVLNGASISCSDNAPIYSRQAKKTILTLAEGTDNSVQDGTVYTYAEGEDEPDAAIFSKGDLTINGSGVLNVEGNANNGIGTKDDLVIISVRLNVTAANDGLRGRDSIVIKDGIYNVAAKGDGLQSNNDEEADKGWISIDGGDFTITSEKDGIQAETILQINDGQFNLKTGGGSANAAVRTEFQGRPGFQENTNKASGVSEEESDSAKGLKAKSSILVKDGNFTIDSSDDAIHSNGTIQIKAGDYNISSGDDGIHADSSLTVDGGTIIITKCYEGLESAQITINDGTIHLTAQDDGFNAAGGNDGSTGVSYFIRIAGGYIYLDAAGDGIDSNGALYFNGGTVLVNGPTNNGNGPLDYNGTCQLTGGILAIAGSSGMAQAPGNTSSQNSLIVYYSTVQKAGTLVTLADESGKSMLSYVPTKDYQSIVISTPDLEQGKTYTLLSGGMCSNQLIDGLSIGGTCVGGTKLTDITLSAVTTSVSDNGSQVSGGGMRGMGGQGRPDGAQQPDGNRRPPGNR